MTFFSHLPYFRKIDTFLLFRKNLIFPIFVQFTCFLPIDLIFAFSLSPYLCTMLYTYWTPLRETERKKQTEIQIGYTLYSCNMQGVRTAGSNPQSSDYTSRELTDFLQLAPCCKLLYWCGILFYWLIRFAMNPGFTETSAAEQEIETSSQAAITQVLINTSLINT